jgi:t-SNARE complex subunit (syntaxin)
MRRSVGRSRNAWNLRTVRYAQPCSDVLLRSSVANSAVERVIASSSARVGKGKIKGWGKVVVVVVVVVVVRY